ncbi:MAG TPA: hypothetical protein PLB35_04660 [Myxococcota bacterium]|nr:hypothetical protein [Myxococcota bacterium]HOH76524.1 hypothetical protein [Myxococcota bacterium]HPV04796.1 hypothetical protein [Myxococcota bacterium]
MAQRKKFARIRLLAASLALVACIHLPCRARADFGDIRNVFSGTAWTLQEGDFVVGIIGPMTFGLVDQFTLTTHPILDLLLIPNVNLKWKFFDNDKVALALDIAYIQSFLDTELTDIPGSLSPYMILSVPIKDVAALTFRAGYVLELSPNSHGLTYGAEVSWLVTAADLISVGVSGQYHPRGRGADVPTVTATYTHAWDSIRLSVGIAVGSFLTRVGDNAEDVFDVPVYPIIDVWWLL